MGLGEGLCGTGWGAAWDWVGGCVGRGVRAGELPFAEQEGEPVGRGKIPRPVSTWSEAPVGRSQREGRGGDRGGGGGGGTPGKA